MMGRLLDFSKLVWYVLVIILTLVLTYFVVQVIYNQVIGVIKAIGFSIVNFVPFAKIMIQVVGLPVGVAYALKFIKFIMRGAYDGKRKKET